MRRIVAGVFVSLDGVMQAPGGPDEDPTGGFELGGWTAPYWDEVMDQSIGALFAQPFDLLLGRKTYDIFAAHWPYYTDDPIGMAFNRVAKYVVTSSAEALAWANSHAINDGLEGVERLKAGDGPDLLIQGSISLYPGLLKRRLINSFLLMTFPVVLGRGKKLFAQNISSGALRLVDSKVSSTGVLIATYEPAGAVPLGSFAAKPPSDAELARRAKIRAED
jgi:dihydrofolate reductase